MVIHSGPSISANASGTYTYYIRETGTTVPSHPDPVEMTISGAARGLGWIDFRITAITINGSNHLTNAQYGEAPTETIGYMAVVGGLPLSDSAENDDFSFTVEKASAWDDDSGTYDWTASGEAVRKIARWDGGQWVVHNDTSDPAYTHTTSTSGSWTVAKTNVCSFCKRTGVSSPTAHHVTCPNSNCNAGGSYWNCYGVPASHALLATCSSCNASNVYACSGHPGSCTSNSGSSSGCANNETYDYCDDQGSCSEGSTSGVPGPICGHNHCCCSPSSSSSTGSTPPSNNGGSSGGSTPPSSNTATCSTCNAPYNSNNSSLVNRHRVRTCMRPACGQSWQLCSGGKPETCGASSSWRCRE
ncbi:MAG: hypothetical protein OXH00_04020 [Candidatus Poribacteria bacterium]|nr:hypothetical protein [Candidatus Poribacteria bacterium]